MATTAGDRDGVRGLGLGAESLRRFADQTLDLSPLNHDADPRLRPEFASLLVRPSLQQVWGVSNGQLLSNSMDALLLEPEEHPQAIGFEGAIQSIRDFEASDPQELRDWVAQREATIREIFPDVQLDVLEPVRGLISLPGGSLLRTETLHVTRDGTQMAIDRIEAAVLAERGGSVDGSGPTPESRFLAEALCRSTYGMRPLEEEDRGRFWSERLGRLVRHGWELLLDQALALEERAQRVKWQSETHEPQQRTATIVREPGRSEGVLEATTGKGPERLQRFRRGGEVSEEGAEWTR